MLDFAPTPQPESTPDFEAFRQQAYQITGLDLTCYKVPQMHRRLSVLLTKVGVRTFAEYARLLEQDPAAPTGIPRLRDHQRVGVLS